MIAHRHLLLTLVGALLSIAARHAAACERLAFWSRLPDTGSEMTSPVSLALLGAAVAPPAAMAPTGADHHLRLIAMHNLHGSPNAEPVSVWTPFVLPAVVLGVNVVATAVQQCTIVRPTSAMLQAMGLTFLFVSSLKVATGRTWPSAGRNPNAPDYYDHPESARQFHWFSWDKGYAWPSGHTAIMVSAAAALSSVEYGQSWVGYVAYAGATAVAAGMWLGDHHWMSDIVSGALIGGAIGRGVGLAFRREKSRDESAGWTVLPYTSRDLFGLQALARW